MTIPNNRYSAKRGKQTGTPNKRGIGAAFKKFGRTVNPWGTNVPNRRVGLTNAIGQTQRSRTNSTQGSATRRPKQAPQERGMQYKPNDPTQWPVEPDFVNHTRAPDPYGITPTVITNVNKAVNHAFKRGGYPEP